jgi:hypothetical protein
MVDFIFNYQTEATTDHQRIQLMNFSHDNLTLVVSFLESPIEK